MYFIKRKNEDVRLHIETHSDEDSDWALLWVLQG